MNNIFNFDDFFYGTNDLGLTGLMTRSNRNFYPKADVTQNDESYVIEMDLPGISDKDVDVQINKDVLTISSKDEQEKTNEVSDKEDAKDKIKYLLKERSSYSFTREFSLPDDADKESVKATFYNGVLNITFKRKALEAPKKIAINA